MASRLRALDAALARRALDEFEASHGLDLHAPRVVVADLPAVVRALTPEDRPLVEHHWSTGVASAVDGLGRIAAITTAVDERADVVGVVWDRLGGAPEGEDVDATRARVEAFCAEHATGWPNLVVDAEREALLRALRIPVATLPFTRVLDLDGGVLRTFAGPLSEADVDTVLALVAR